MCACGKSVQRNVQLQCSEWCAKLCQWRHTELHSQESMELCWIHRESITERANVYFTAFLEGVKKFNPPSPHHHKPAMCILCVTQKIQVPHKYPSPLPLHVIRWFPALF